MNFSMLEEKFFKIGIPFLALTSAIFHAFDSNLTIDQTTIWLFVIASIPFLTKYLNTLKVGDMELSFKSLNKEDKIFVFLSSLAQDSLPTFYKPREGESELGLVGKHLVSEMKNTNPARLHEEIKNWLSNSDNGMKWLSSEIVGYFELTEFSKELVALYDIKQTKVDWEKWKLNCLWAHSKLENGYTELDDFLKETESTHNQVWLFDVYYQMAESDLSLKNEFLEKCEYINESKSLSQESKEKLEKVIGEIKRLGNE